MILLQSTIVDLMNKIEVLESMSDASGSAAGIVTANFFFLLCTKMSKRNIYLPFLASSPLKCGQGLVVILIQVYIVKVMV